MSDDIIEKIKRAKMTGNLGSKIATAVLAVLGYSNWHLGQIETRESAYRYLKKVYGGLAKSYEPSADKSIEIADVNNKIVWICWWQGEENASPIVQQCISSIRYWLEKDWKITVITKDNYLKYVKFPQFIEDKWGRGIISNTHMSDLLRLELLIRYGGLWLDATTLLTGKLPEYVSQKTLFLLKVMSKENARIQYNSWFIFSQKDNPLLKTTLYLLYQYWTKEKKIREYFLWHLMLTLVIEEHPEYVRDIYYVPDELEHILQNIWFEKYDPEYWKLLTSWTSIHKLSNKAELPEDISGTYYEKIVKGEL